MKTRAITGIFFIITLVGSILAGPWIFACFFLLVSLLALAEFYKIVDASAQTHKWAGMLLAFILFFFTILSEMGTVSDSSILFTIPAAILVVLLELFKRSEKPFNNIAFTFFGVLYAVVPFIFFVKLAFVGGAFNYSYPLGFLILLWTSDTGAYLSGRTLGKTKLFERHSPKKTWEGAVGGLILSVIAAVILSIYFTQLSSWQWITSAVLIVVFGTYGDLTESMLKRSYGIKDSGNILPGHGGILDRFDGLLLAAPLVYLFLQLTT